MQIAILGRGDPNIGWLLKAILPRRAMAPSIT